MTLGFKRKIKSVPLRQEEHAQLQGRLLGLGCQVFLCMRVPLWVRSLLCEFGLGPICGLARLALANQPSLGRRTHLVGYRLTTLFMLWL